MKTFCLKWSNYEDGKEYHFTSTDHNIEDVDFKSDCNHFLSEAAENAMIKNDDGLIGWDILVDELALLLEREGYKLLKLYTIEYFGPMVINEHNDNENLEKNVLNKIISFNNKFFNKK